MNTNDCESRLRKLGEDWKNEPEFVAQILKQIENENPVSNQRQFDQNETIKRPIIGGNQMLKLNLIGLSTVAMVLLGLFFFLPDTAPVSASSLSSAIRQAIAEVKTVHIATYAPDEESDLLKHSGDTWFARGKGYARIGVEFFEIDDGHYYWKRKNKESIVTRTKSQDFDAVFEDMTFPESDYQRLPAEDLTVNGERQSCYSIKNLAPFADGPQRSYIYVTPGNRIFKTVTWMSKDKKWKLMSENRFSYNVDIDPSVFEPDLEVGTKVVDLDQQFDQLFGLNDSLFRQTVNGFEYAVHRVRALKGGGVLMLASVRPSDIDARRFRA